MAKTPRDVRNNTGITRSSPQLTKDPRDVRARAPAPLPLIPSVQRSRPPRIKIKKSSNATRFFKMTSETQLCQTRIGRTIRRRWSVRRRRRSRHVRHHVALWSHRIVGPRHRRVDRRHPNDRVASGVRISKRKCELPVLGRKHQGHLKHAGVDLLLFHGWAGMSFLHLTALSTLVLRANNGAPGLRFRGFNLLGVIGVRLVSLGSDADLRINLRFDLDRGLGSALALAFDWRNHWRLHGRGGDFAWRLVVVTFGRRGAVIGAPEGILQMLWMKRSGKKRIIQTRLGLRHGGAQKILQAELWQCDHGLVKIRAAIPGHRDGMVETIGSTLKFDVRQIREVV
mmetsp:Transcript_3649/g.8607  ORF Transcript_3649/g.8607 Transcript_3649/m.8607 type:complete len:340 (-) Transcript_3649:89-1108(-)